MSVIDLQDWKKKKQIEQDQRPKLYVDQLNGKVYGKKPIKGSHLQMDGSKTTFLPELGRIDKVKISLDKIDRIMSELKLFNEKNNSPR